MKTSCRNFAQKNRNSLLGSKIRGGRVLGVALHVHGTTYCMFTNELSNTQTNIVTPHTHLLIHTHRFQWRIQDLPGRRANSWISCENLLFSCGFCQKPHENERILKGTCVVSPWIRQWIQYIAHHIHAMHCQ